MQYVSLIPLVGIPEIDDLSGTVIERIFSPLSKQLLISSASMTNALVVIFMGSRPDYSVSDKIQNCLRA